GTPDSPTPIAPPQGRWLSPSGGYPGHKWRGHRLHGGVDLRVLFRAAPSPSKAVPAALSDDRVTQRTKRILQVVRLGGGARRGREPVRDPPAAAPGLCAVAGARPGEPAPARKPLARGDRSSGDTGPCPGQWLARSPCPPPASDRARHAP